jgi:hypothetical protein
MILQLSWKLMSVTSKKMLIVGYLWSFSSHQQDYQFLQITEVISRFVGGCTASLLGSAALK